jgi:hypothetical protein
MSAPRKTDPEWSDYLLAVHGLASLPNLVDDRKRAARQDEEATLERARANLEMATAACGEWQVLAKRALTTGEAQLVASRILVPDASMAPTITSEVPEHLVEGLAALEQKLASEVDGLQEARRIGRVRAMERAAEASRKAAQRRELLKIAGAIALIILGAILLGVVF